MNDHTDAGTIFGIPVVVMEQTPESEKLARETANIKFGPLTKEWAEDVMRAVAAERLSDADLNRSTDVRD